MTSPASKYIGIDSKGNRVMRTDLMLLDALTICDGPATTDALVEIADPRNLAQLRNNEAIRLLTFALADGYVDRTDVSKNGLEMRAWIITNKGRAHLIAQEARQIFDECASHTPVARDRRSTDRPRIEEAPAPPEPIRRTPAGEKLFEELKGSHAQVDSQSPISVSVCDAQERPMTALLCVDEDELDNWWNSLDVEMKADAFAQFALHMHDGEESHVYVERTDRVPFAGVIGDLSQSLTDKLRGAGIAAVQS